MRPRNRGLYRLQGPDQGRALRNLRRGVHWRSDAKHWMHQVPMPHGYHRVSFLIISINFQKKLHSMEITQRFSTNWMKVTEVIVLAGATSSCHELKLSPSKNVTIHKPRCIHVWNPNAKQEANTPAHVLLLRRHVASDTYVNPFARSYFRPIRRQVILKCFFFISTITIDKSHDNPISRLFIRNEYQINCIG